MPVPPSTWCPYYYLPLLLLLLLLDRPLCLHAQEDYSLPRLYKNRYRGIFSSWGDSSAARPCHTGRVRGWCVSRVRYPKWTAVFPLLCAARTRPYSQQKGKQGACNYKIEPAQGGTWGIRILNSISSVSPPTNVAAAPPAQLQPSEGQPTSSAGQVGKGKRAQAFIAFTTVR